MYDKDDECPNTHKGTGKSVKGCPDSDGDGIPDYKDTYPNDKDNDAIPDSKDKCPNTHENFNGYQDNDGCTDYPPVADSDGDGFPDPHTAGQHSYTIDLCPTKKMPASKAPYWTHNGCP